MTDAANDLAATTEHAKNTLTFMAKVSIPLTPENYHVLYEYLRGENPDLMEDVKALLSRGEGISSTAVQDLYGKHFGQELERASIEWVHTQTNRLLKGIIEDALNAHALTSEYNERLTGHLEQLDGSSKLSRLREVVEKLILDTTRMAESSRHLEEKLDMASSQIEMLKRQLREARHEALVDPLTGLNNRRAFETRLKDALEGFGRHAKPFCVIMLDVDNFKALNDKYGHVVGDAVLQTVAATLNECLRGGDIPARYGGEEFVTMVARTGIADTCVVAERIRRSIGEKRFKIAKTGEMIGRVTVSLGVAESRRDDTVESIVSRADKALYCAKSSGRNVVKSEVDL